MASQRVLIFAIGGSLADIIWADICRWSESRTIQNENEWSPDDWPTQLKHEIDNAIDKLMAHAYTPPVLYRSEHVDTWSMGDVFERALRGSSTNDMRQLLTSRYEIFARRAHFSDRVKSRKTQADETKWLNVRINEAIAAWGEFAEDRLILLVRIVLGGLWQDAEVTQSLSQKPSWWREAD
jgi:hypothetical protein